MSCVQIPEENQAAALLHYLGISRTRKGYWYIRWILEWGRQEEMDEARFYTRLVRRCKVPRLQMARDMYRAQRRVDTLRNYLEEAEYGNHWEETKREYGAAENRPQGYRSYDTSKRGRHDLGNL